MASVGYNIAKEKMATGLFDLEDAGVTVKVMALTASATTPDNPDHEFVADIVADEMSDASYSRITVSSKVGTRNNTTNKYEIDSADWNFGALDNETVLYLVTYVEVTNDADSWLVSCHDVSDVATDGSGYTGQIGANGFINIA